MSTLSTLFRKKKTTYYGNYESKKMKLSRYHNHNYDDTLKHIHTKATWQETHHNVSVTITLY